MKVTVTQGDVTVTSVDLVYDTPDIKILEIHTDQKHPAPGGYSSGYFQVVEPSDWHPWGHDMVPTVVNFDFERGEDNWAQVCDADRYHLTVVLFRYHLDHGHRAEVYRKEEA